jgi:hypothetical protein
VTLAGGTVTFMPDPDFNGAAGFAYTVADGEGAPATGRAAVTVRPVNDAPVAAADEVGADQDRELAIDAAALLANDRDADGDGLAVTGVSGAEHGSVSIDGSQVRFAPAAGFHGAARFVYQAGDGHGGAASATVTVNVAEAKGEVKGEEESGGELLLSCSKRAVVLEDVVPAGRRVKLFGVTERKHAGQRAEIRFLATGKVVARPVVGQDGRFSATAPMPSGRLRHSNKARYDARIGGERSLALKLERRMLVTGVRASGGKVTITGKVVGPLASKPRDRVIEIQRRRTCATTEVVARVMPGAGGRFRATVAAPASERAAVYRLRTKVRRSAASPKLFETFTLPRAVDF